MKRLICCMFLLVALIPYVRAIAVSPASINIDFSPGEKYNMTLTIFNNGNSLENLKVSIDGDLSEYASLSDPRDELISIDRGETKKIQIMLSLPKDMDRAGKLRLNVQISETTGPGGPIAILTGISIPITLNVPYPGKYMEISLEPNDVSENEKPSFKATVKNFGVETIGKTIIHVDVYENDALREKLSSELLSDIISQGAEFAVLRSSQRYKPGFYHVEAYAVYDGKNTQTIKGLLKVGQLFVNITDYTRRLEADKVNRFTLKVKSLWNKGIGNLNADIVLLDLDNRIKDKVKTSTMNLGEWGEATLETFLDTANLTSGTYMVNATLNYEDKKDSRILPVWVNEKQQAVVKEEPKQLTETIVPGIFMTIATIIIVDFIKCAWLKKRQKKDVNEFKKKLDQEI